MSRILTLAKEVKTMSQSIYDYFKAQGNQARMGHMKVIYDAAEKIRYKLEAEPELTIPSDTWKAILAIQHMGYSASDDFDSNEKLVMPVYERFFELQKSYLRAYEKNT